MPSKDGPMNLRQKGMGGGRGSSAPSGGGRGAIRAESRRQLRAGKRTKSVRPDIGGGTRYLGYATKNRAGEKQSLAQVPPYGNRQIKSDFKAGNTAMRGFVSRSVSPRMSKAPVKPSKSVGKRQAKFK